MWGVSFSVLIVVKCLEVEHLRLNIWRLNLSSRYISNFVSVLKLMFCWLYPFLLNQSLVCNVALIFMTFF